jgi:hypothetical protein
MADSEQQVLWTKEVEHLLVPVAQPAGELEHLLWGWEQRAELLRILAAHALTGGQPLVASSIYEQVGELEDRIEMLRRNLTDSARVLGENEEE